MHQPFALALSGGGLLGAAHLGALHYLELQGARASAVAGTSAGGLVAALYSLGVPMKELIALGALVSQHPTKYFTLNTVGLVHELLPSTGPPATGLIESRKFVDALLSLAPQALTTDDWQIPTVLTSVDLVSLQAVAFTNSQDPAPPRGGWMRLTGQPLTLVMQATMANPGLFAAPRADNRVLVDGGTADTLPIDWAQALFGGPVIAVNVATPPNVNAAHIGLSEVLSRAESYATDTLSRLRHVKPPAILVQPDTQNVPFMGFHDYQRLVDAGYLAMQQAWQNAGY